MKPKYWPNKDTFHEKKSLDEIINREKENGGIRWPRFLKTQSLLPRNGYQIYLITNPLSIGGFWPSFTPLTTFLMLNCSCPSSYFMDDPLINTKRALQLLNKYLKFAMVTFFFEVIKVRWDVYNCVGLCVKLSTYEVVQSGIYLTYSHCPHSSFFDQNQR